MYQIVFLANAIGAVYERMLVPFAYFALANHPNGFVEMVVVDSDKFGDTYRSELEHLRHLYPQFLVRQMQNKPNGKNRPNTYRFLEVPETAATYTYIMDVDVMLLEDVVAPYEKLWPSTPHINNVVRPGTRRLSGMHMVRSELYFTDKLRQLQQRIYHCPRQTHTNDEEVLYLMVHSCHTLPPRSFQWRPVLGIHFSPNRGPGKGMGLRTYTRYTDAFWRHAEQQPELFAFPCFQFLQKQLRTSFVIR